MTTDSHGDLFDPATNSPHVPERPGPWYQSATGDRIWPLDPRPTDVRILDIARGLANECRFGRMLRTRGLWYSVAEHSALVALHVAHLHPGADKGLLREALLHDAAEAYGFGDVPRPLKHDPWIRPIVEQVEDPWTAAIFARFGIVSTTESRAAIKYVDNLLAYEERAVVTRNPALYARPYPEGEPRLNAAIWCMPPAAAEAAFLHRFGDLFPECRDELEANLLAFG